MQVEILGLPENHNKAFEKDLWLLALDCVLLYLQVTLDKINLRIGVCRMGRWNIFISISRVRLLYWAPVEMVAVQQWIDSNQLCNSLHESFSQWSNILQFIWFCLTLYYITRAVLNFRLMMPSMPIIVKAYRGPDRITTWHWTSLRHQQCVFVKAFFWVSSSIPNYVRKQKPSCKTHISDWHESSSQHGAF